MGDSRRIKLSKADEERASKLHHKSIVVALHTDYIGDVSERRSQGERRVMEKRHVAKLREGGITGICDHVIGDTFECLCYPIRSLVNALYPPSHLEWMKFHARTPCKHALQLTDYMLSDVQESKGISVATSVDEIYKAKREGKIVVVLCAQGCSPIEDDLSLLRNFYRLGFRCMGLVVQQRNLVSDSIWYDSNEGLSSFGEEVVKEANRLGIVIDISHISKKGFMDVLDLSSDPVIASNSNAYTICQHVRNLTDEMIQALAEKGGVIGPHSLCSFVSSKDKPTVQDLLDHIDYITKIAGVDHVGIGPDIVSTDMFPKKISDRIWGEGKPFSGSYPEGLEHISKLMNITRGLVSRGYSDEEIKKILGLNALRVFRTVWGN